MAQLKRPPEQQSHVARLGRRPMLDGLRIIALFKFLKALMLIATGYGVHLLLKQALLERLRLWTASLTDSFAQRLLLPPSRISQARQQSNGNQQRRHHASPVAAHKFSNPVKIRLRPGLDRPLAHKSLDVCGERIE